ncbi:dTDP-4-dehydrorhamnose reductase [Propionivibrio dicarboxylicus]|uniref:dTDP-4-dehydrorhamnose reductase n=1 Tax=Propionivibrio dicarboxylicus TaxID=83767 RepID=A0A1G7VKV4_9RHOO|nr:dTDP-4-dehydrorhamnose reductase [Propionivibrio dicarboxylicus]SDG60029.1 dTDP-4-dehydrorhamnose reductase [Propionivibrio dicarboxylicus]
MKVLLLGKNGQVGWELQRSLAPLGELIALDSRGDGALCGNLLDLAGLAATVREVRPDVIVNAAAYTAVDRAESEPVQARRINAEAPGVLADEATRIGAWLLHYSTDYVFDGSGTSPWREDDATGPLSVYGQTKLEGEQAVARCPKHLIFRTSWVYAARGNNFARTMLRLAQERDALRVIDDQVGAPTGAELLADVTAQILRSHADRPDVAGIYHLVASGETSWHGYARMLIDHARELGVPIRVEPEAIAPITTQDYPLPAGRPANSRLDTTKLQHCFGLVLPDWRVGVRRALDEMLNK